jgi:hypothetical protein
VNASAIRTSGLLALAAGACFAAATALAGDAPPEGALKKDEVSIPFASYHNIRDWQADKDQGLWIQDERRNWYYAKLLGPCFNLDWALHIGFDTRGSSSLDRFSSIVVPDPGFSRGHHERCQFTSLTRSDAPPPKSKHPPKEQKGIDKQAVKEDKAPYSI